MSYKVKKGDTLSKIAKEHNMSLEELLKLNDIPRDKANHILVGQAIKVRKGIPTPTYGTSSSFVPQVMYSSSPKKADNTSTKQTTKDTTTKPQTSTSYWNPIKSFSNTKVKSTDFAGVPYKADYTISEYAKNNASEIQQQLVDMGYDIGASGVDGKWGKRSQEALDKTFSDGYTFKNGKLTDPKVKNSKLVSKEVSKEVLKDPQYLKNNASNIQTLLVQEGFDIGKTGVDGVWGKASQAALDKALAEGYTFDKGKLINPKKVDSQSNLAGYLVGAIKYLQGQTKKAQPSEINSTGDLEGEGNSQNINTGSAFYISYPEHEISTSGTGFEFLGSHLPRPIKGHAASIIIDDKGNATYHTYGRYGDKGSYHSKSLPARRTNESEPDYLKRIRKHLEYAAAGEPVKATYITNVDANKARQYYKEQPQKDNYGFFTGSTCVGEACAGINAGRSTSTGDLAQFIMPNTPNSPHVLNYRSHETYTI